MGEPIDDILTTHDAEYARLFETIRGLERERDHLWRMLYASWFGWVLTFAMMIWKAS